MERRGITLIDTNSVLGLLKQETERDKQRLVGPSNLSNPCTFCLGKDMTGSPEPRSRYWMGAVVGTMMHADMERRVRERLPGALVEQRVTVGDIPGYGTIKGSCDLYLDGQVLDWKSTTRDKLTFYRRAYQEEPDPLEVTKISDARMTLARYWNQTHLYGLGMENAGLPVHTLTVAFLCRDGKEDRDVWSVSREYDRSIAEKVLTRASRLWEYLQDGGGIESLNSARGCYTCSTERRV